MIQTDTEGKAKVSFYNSDKDTAVTGVIEGISGAGLPGKSVFRYEILK